MTTQNVTGSSFSSDCAYLMQVNPRKARSAPSIFPSLSVSCSSSISQQSHSSQKSSQAALPIFSSSPPLLPQTQAISFESEMRASNQLAQQQIDTPQPPPRKRRDRSSKKQKALSTSPHLQTPFSLIQSSLMPSAQLHSPQIPPYTSPPMTVSPTNSFWILPNSSPFSQATPVAIQESSLQSTLQSPIQRIPSSLQYPAVGLIPFQQTPITRLPPSNPPPSKFHSTGQLSTLVTFVPAASPSQLASANAIASLKTPPLSFAHRSAIAARPTPIHVANDWQTRIKRRQPIPEQTPIAAQPLKAPKTSISNDRDFMTVPPVAALAVMKMQHWLQERGLNLDIPTCQAALSSFFDPSNLPD